MHRYITTSLPYINSSPHIGFATELIRADALARYWRLSREEVLLNTGTDEHGQKVFESALANGQTPQEYADRLVSEFKGLIPVLGISPEAHFIRTTDAHHIHAAQEMWRRCEANGDIYKAVQKTHYCVGCELEKTDSELIDGRCPLHPNLPIEVREEENYFFRFSKYQEPLMDFYGSHPTFVIPAFRQGEIEKFVASGLRDFSISRLKEKMSWGVPVPGDDSQVMFVWFDALTNYISTLDWPEKEDFDGWWPGIQLAGKDNLRQQAAIWQAMLMSAGLPNSKQVFIGGFITSGGQKMSKSLGNVISPYELVEKYGTEATRFLLLRHVHPTEDSDITWEKLDEWYTADLVNGIGNLVARIMKLAQDNLEGPVARPEADDAVLEYWKPLDDFKFNEALDAVWHRIKILDERIAMEQPFKVVKDDAPKGRAMIAALATELYGIARALNPFMPETSAIVKDAVLANKKPENLFPRLT